MDVSNRVSPATISLSVYITFGCTDNILFCIYHLNLHKTHIYTCITCDESFCREIWLLEAFWTKIGMGLGTLRVS